MWILSETMLISYVIHQTRDIQTLIEKRVENTTRSRVFFFYEILAVWIADEMLSRVFGISSESKQKLRSKRRSKIVKFYVN